MRSAWTWGRLAPGLVGLVCVSVLATAHELGTIRTYVTFQKDGGYRAEVFIDREHLPPGFGNAPVRPRSPIRGLSPALERDRVGRILSEVLNHSRLCFDGRPANAEASWTGSGPADSEPILRLTGDIPEGARSFTWSDSLNLGSYLLTLQTEGDNNPTRQWLEGSEVSKPFVLKSEAAAPSLKGVVLQYLGLGFTHILPRGADHILFVLGIFLLTTRLKPVLAQVTAFTVAHTITLALTMYGVVSLPSSIVEPLIAASIVYVAIENIVRPKLSARRLALVFGFGLLHGMGFAGVLSQLGLPRQEFVPALLSFNAGVELGQLTVILAAFLLVGLPFHGTPWYRRRIVVPASLAISAVGLFWAVTRVAASFGT